MAARVRKGITYQMTIVPTNFSAALEMLPAELARMGLPNTLLGTDWATVANRCAEIMVASVDAAARLGPRAKHLSRSAAYPRDEYDAQNLFFLTLKPWLPDLEHNPFQISYAGQKKYADLAAAASRLVIEVKYVYDSGSAAAVVKQLTGLAELYSLAPTTEAIIFAILVANSVSWDSSKIDSSHTHVERRPVILTRSIALPDLSGL